MDVSQLKKLGGKEWKKRGLHRVYFNRDALKNILGLQLQYGRHYVLTAARLFNRRIDVSDAENMLYYLNRGSFWYDVRLRIYCQKGMPQELYNRICERIESQVG